MRNNFKAAELAVIEACRLRKEGENGVERAYNVTMGTYIIKNRVPSSDEMGRDLGLTPKRIAEVRDIMRSPSGRASTKRSGRRSRAVGRKTAAKRSSGRR